MRFSKATRKWINVWTADLSKNRSLNEGMTASYQDVSLSIEMQKTKGPSRRQRKWCFRELSSLISQQGWGHVPHSTTPCPQESGPLVHIFCLTSYEWSLTCWAKIKGEHCLSHHNSFLVTDWDCYHERWRHQSAPTHSLAHHTVHRFQLYNSYGRNFKWLGVFESSRPLDRVPLLPHITPTPKPSVSLLHASLATSTIATQLALFFLTLGVQSCLSCL